MKHSILKVLNYITGDAESIKAIHGIRSSPAGSNHHRSITLFVTVRCAETFLFFFFKEVNFTSMGLETSTLFASTATLKLLPTNYTAYL